jgi:class 3 adenylate cyclase
MARLENLAIMFVDMAGFAERTARQTREQNKSLLRDFAGLLIPLIARFGGRHVKSIGDALLVAFRSPTDSVRCGMAMHDAIVAYNNERRSDDPIQIRVALNVGEVRLEPDDVFGEAVNIAARVEELTPPGEIYLTGVVYLSMNKAEVPAEHIGERMLKGVPEPVRLFRVPPHKLSRLTLAGEPLDPSPNELPYGGMHRLPPDAHVLARLAESLRRAPYVDWGAKARAVPVRPILTGIAALGVASALLAVAYAVIAVKPAPPPAQAAVAPDPAPAPAPVTAAILPPPPAAPDPRAREALADAHTAFFERKRVTAARGYAKALELDPQLRHDSGLAANLVGTLGFAGDLPVMTIRRYRSPEFVYELGRRTSRPGRNGAQRAAALLDEFEQAGRIDQGGMALTELAEAPSCEERLAAVRKLRALREPRALPLLRETTRRSGWFSEDKNACLREEARQAIAELEKLVPATAASR